MNHKRFYGAKVPKAAVSVEDQALAHEQDDLVKAHLSRNFAYFGAIDKTLSGFMILSDEDDNYLLYDLRKPNGPIYFQDHETRECYPKFESLLAYKAFLSECRRRASDDEFYKWELCEEKYQLSRKEQKALTKKTKGELSSLELLERYQWLVWFFAQPMRNAHGLDQSPQHFANEAIGRFLYAFKNAAAVKRAFKREKSLITTDTHVAIYWLLHSAVCADEARRTEVLAMAKKLKTPLWCAFRDRFSEMPLGDNLKVLKSFRERRSAFVFRDALGNKEQSDALRDRLLTSFKIDHKGESINKALWLTQRTRDVDREVIRSGIKGLRGASTGLHYLRAQFDLWDGKEQSAHVKKLVDSLGKKGVETPDVLQALWFVLPLVSAEKPVHARVHEAALERLEEKPFSSGLLTLLVETAPNTRVRKKYATRREALTAIEEVDAQLLSLDKNERSKGRRKRGKLDKETQLLMARKMMTGSTAYQDNSDVLWAFEEVFNASFKGRLDELVGGIAKAGVWARKPFLKKLKPQRTSSKIDKDKTEILLRLVETPEAAGDFMSGFALENMKEQACQLLSPVATRPAVFKRLMAVMDTPELVKGRKVISDELLDVKGDYTKFAVQAELSNAQAKEAARRMIAHSMSDEPEHSLYYMRHKGAEDVLIEALQTVTHPRTVGSLYSAVQNMQTRRSQDVILGRLFVDEQNIWRLLDAVSDIWTKDVHKRALAMLEARADHAAINRYMWSMVDFAHNGRAALDTLELSLGLETNSAADRGLQKMVLLEGVKLALEAGKEELAKRAWRVAEASSEAPRSIYHEVRDQKWDNPLDAATRKRLSR